MIIINAENWSDIFGFRVRSIQRCVQRVDGLIQRDAVREGDGRTPLVGSLGSFHFHGAVVASLG